MKPAPKAGRPYTVPGGMRRCTVMLDAPTIARARELGGGNLSLGLRLAVAQVSQDALQVRALLDRESDEIPPAASPAAPESTLD